MGRHVAVIVHYIAKAIQRLGATRDRDGLRHRSIAVIVPGINKADVWPLDPDGEILLMGIVEEAEGVRDIHRKYLPLYKQELMQRCSLLHQTTPCGVYKSVA